MKVVTKQDKPEIAKMIALPIIDVDNPGKIYSEKEEKYLREVCKFVFSNLEEPGLMHQFSYGTPTNKMRFSFFHGGTYEVPRFIARHVESRGTPLYKWTPDGQGSMDKTPAGKKARFQMREVYS